MARHTSLYQAPRSPLIQGRTRWERPLWQAWLGGILAGATVAAVEVSALRVPLLLMRVSGVLLPLAAVGIVMAGLGASLAKLFGWRARWLGAAVLSGLGVSAVMFLWYTFTAVTLG